MAQPKTDEKPYSTRVSQVSDLEAYVGKELGLTKWVTITQEKIDTFAQATEDFQWIHTDPRRAAQFSPYKTTVAHGFLVLSLASKFCYEAYHIEDAALGINYGLDRVRFPKAVPVGARLRGRIALMEYQSLRKAARLKLKVTFEIEGERRPACIAEFIAVVFTAPESQPAVTKASLGADHPQEP
ncbi:MAG: MaoC family dehydratase [Bacteroidetes bacterium]|nr:MAG: MaoC family dehydratase [Bacteroidota bacterium]